MDFYSKLKYQQNVLTCDNHVNYIWDKIHGQTEQLENDEDSEHFYNHIPVNFHKFLAECIHLLLNNTLGICLEDPDKKYLTALTLTGLQENDVPSESKSVPSQATILFLTIAAMDDGSVFDLPTLQYLTTQMIQSLRRKLSYCYTISCSTFLCLNKFLHEAEQNIDQIVNRVLYFLRDAIDDSPVVIDNFNLDEDANKIQNKAIFICFKTILERKYTMEQLKQIVSRISIILIQCVNNKESVRGSVTYFFKYNLHKQLKHLWYIKLLTLLIEQITDQDIFVAIINEITSTDNYYSVVRSVLNHFVKYSNKNFDTHLAILYGIIAVPHPTNSDEIREMIIKKITKQICLKSADRDIAVKEKIMSVFIKLFKLRDIHVRRCLQQMFRDDVASKISAKVLFGILESDVDIKWKHLNYNTNFVILTCHMFVTNKEFISAYRLKVIEILCSRATAFSLKQCVPSIVEVINRYAVENNPVIVPMLSLLIDNALKPTTAANYYIKEIYDLISDVMVSSVDCDTALAVCNIILTDDFDFVNLLKTFETHNLITNKQLQVLFEETALKRKPMVWKLLSLFLDLNYFNPFPPYMKFMVLSCSDIEFYGKPESLCMIQVITKIFSKKLQHSVLNGDDKLLAVTVESMFSNHVERRHVPIKHVNDVIILLLTLQKITGSNTDWMQRLFYESLDAILEDIYLQPRVYIVQRNLAYMTKIFMLTKVKLEDVHMTRLKEIMGFDNQQDVGVSDGVSWGLFVAFYGKICLKYPNLITPTVPYFQFAILYGTPYVQQIAMYTLYDLCSIRLNYYEPFESVIMELIANENVEVKTSAVRMLVRLVNDDHIRLSCSDFIVFMLVLIDRQLKMSLYYKDILEKDFLHRNESLVAKYFIHLLLFLNNYKNHPLFPILDITLETTEYTHERRLIVLKLLFGNLQRYNQFQILNVLSSEVLQAIYTGQMAPTHQVLNIFRDVINVVLVAAMQYINDDVVIDDGFHVKLLASIKKDFFSRKQHNKIVEGEFNSIVDHLMTNLLDVLYKIERLNKDLLPLLFNIIMIATKAYYDRLLNVIYNTARLRDLYSELPNFYENYKEMITAEPVNVSSWEREEWRLYLDYME